MVKGEGTTTVIPSAARDPYGSKRSLRDLSLLRPSDMHFPIPHSPFPVPFSLFPFPRFPLG
jgi:hypothetical protein